MDGSTHAPGGVGLSASVGCAAQIVNISSTLGSIGEEAKFLKEDPEENNTRVMASNAVGYRASKAALNASEYCATN